MTPVLFSADKRFFSGTLFGLEHNRPKDGAYRCLVGQLLPVSRHNTPAIWADFHFLGFEQISPNHRHGRKLHGHGPTISFNLGKEIPGVHCSILGPETKKSERSVVSRFPVSVQLDVGGSWGVGKNRSSLRYGKLWSLPWFLWILRG